MIHSKKKKAKERAAEYQGNLKKSDHHGKRKEDRKNRDHTRHSSISSKRKNSIENNDNCSDLFNNKSTKNSTIEQKQNNEKRDDKRSERRHEDRHRSNEKSTHHSHSSSSSSSSSSSTSSNSSHSREKKKYDCNHKLDHNRSHHNRSSSNNTSSKESISTITESKLTNKLNIAGSSSKEGKKRLCSSEICLEHENFDCNTVSLEQNILTQRQLIAKTYATEVVDKALEIAIYKSKTDVEEVCQSLRTGVAEASKEILEKIHKESFEIAEQKYKDDKTKLERYCQLLEIETTLAFTSKMECATENAVKALIEMAEDEAKERSKNEKVSMLINNTCEENSLSVSKIANSSSSSSITSTSLLTETERHSSRNISSDENSFKLSSDIHTTHSESKRKHKDDKSSRSQRHKDRRDRDRHDKEHKRHHHRSPQSNKYENKTGEINKEDSLKIISLSKDCNISNKTTDRTDSKDSDRKLEKRRDGHHSHPRDGQKKSSSNRSSKDDTVSSRSHSSSSNHKRKSNSSERKESKKACIEKNITTAITEQNILGNTLTLITVTTVAQSTTTNTFVST